MAYLLNFSDVHFNKMLPVDKLDMYALMHVYLIYVRL